MVLRKTLFHYTLDPSQRRAGFRVIKWTTFLFIKLIVMYHTYAKNVNNLLYGTKNPTIFKIMGHFRISFLCVVTMCGRYLNPDGRRD